MRKLFNIGAEEAQTLKELSMTFMRTQCGLSMHGLYGLNLNQRNSLMAVRALVSLGRHNITVLGEDIDGISNLNTHYGHLDIR